LHKRTGGATLGHQTERAERRQKESLGGSVNEVGEGDQRGRKSDDGTVERRNEDLGVGVESLSAIEIVCHEGLEPEPVSRDGGRRGRRFAGAGDVCTRREEPAYADEEGDEDFIVGRDLAEGLG